MSVESASLQGADSFLGHKGQVSSGPIEALWTQHRASGPLPAFVTCPARRSAGQKVTGLNRCMHALCPQCNAERQSHLRRKLEWLFVSVKEAGYGMQHITLTLSHGSGTPLLASIKAIIDFWRCARSGSPYKRLSQENGLIGAITVLEVVWSTNGWNAHLHAIIFARSPRCATACAQALKVRYENAIVRAGGVVTERTVLAAPVNDPARLASYLAKQWDHASDSGGRPPLMLLRAALEGCSRAAELFCEAADALKGRRRIMISRRVTRVLRPTSELIPKTIPAPAVKGVIDPKSHTARTPLHPRTGLP